MKRLLFIQLIAAACFLSINGYGYSTQIHNITYESAEHIFSGDQVRLKGLRVNKDNVYPFILPNGIVLTYGEILAMPDYYGDPKHQISSGKTFNDRALQFNNIFTNFSHADTAYFNAFWPIVMDERTKIQDAIKNHESVSDVYNTIVDKENIDLVIATKLRYIVLAANAMDHFNADAIKAYQAGHTVAIKSALIGYKIKSGQSQTAKENCKSKSNISSCLDQAALAYLNLAYEQNAYASHFLSDIFASGHMRTPFRQLLETRPVSALGGVSGGIMHNEDNKFGLIVTNDSGKRWVAYGDNYYFSKQNAINKKMQRVVLQLSANEVYTAYQRGYNLDQKSVKLIKKLPRPIPANTYADINGLGHIEQTAPLYLFKQGMVWQRQDVNDRYDHQYTPFWSTLVTLLTYNKTNQPKISSVWKMILNKQMQK